MGFDRHDTLYQSILATVGIYGALEFLLFILVSLGYGFSPIFSAAYVCVHVFFQLAVALLLIAGSGFFRLSNTGERLVKVNSANKITLLRISMLPTLLFLIAALKQHPVGPVLVPVIALTFLTDMVDGSISRAKNQVTIIGKILDAVGDYSLLIVVAFAYRIYDLLPLWLFGIILFRLLFQAAGMLILLIVHRRVEPRPTVFGKIAVATIMVLFAAEPLKRIFPTLDRSVVLVEKAAGFIVAVSLVDKGWYFLKGRKIRTD